jgi:hypothetical protein
VYIILALDHPEGSVNDVIGILVKFFLREILKLLGYLLRKLLFTTLLALKADCEFSLAASARTTGDLKESLLIFGIDSK